jgi:spore protease
MTISRVRIKDEEGSKAMGKPIGYYVTLEVPRLKEKDPALTEEVSKNMADELERMVEIPIEATILVIGLGNWNVTPDSLGPKVIEKLIVTNITYHCFHINYKHYNTIRKKPHKP